MAALHTALLLAVVTTAVMSQAESSNNTNRESVLKTNERFRRLIPYMTYYFTQQTMANRPQYQQYPSSLITGPYVVRVNPQQTRYTPQVPSPVSFRHQFRPAKIQVAPLEPTNYNGFQNAYIDPLVLQTYSPPHRPVKTYTALPPVPNIHTRQKIPTLMQILNILQLARKLPQIPGMGNEETLAQILTILHQSSELSPEVENTLAKILMQLLQSKKLNPLPTVTNGANGLKLLPHRPQYIHPNEASLKPFQPLYAPVTYTPVKVPQFIPTPNPDFVQDFDDYQSYRKPIKIHPNLNVVHSKPLTITSKYTTKSPLISTVPATSLAQNINDLQNYDYVTKVPKIQSNTQDIKPIVDVDDESNKVQVSSTVAPQSENDELRPYDYAPKQVLYGLKTHVQSYPDPDSKGSTPGRPGVDYPILEKIPETAFSCKSQRYKGFFGDPDTSCQVWHYCDLNGGQASFLCPNGTIFSQVALTCDWWYNVRCASTTQLYVLNERLYKYILPVTPSFPEDFSGPLVDRYLTLKFKELELKNKSMANTTKV